MTVIAALNIKRRIALTEDNRVLPITNMVDGDGETTDDPKQAAAVIIKETDDRWLVVMTKDYERLKMQ